LLRAKAAVAATNNEWRLWVTGCPPTERGGCR
jgi:hypothetical protein